MSTKKDSMLHIRVSESDREKIKNYADKLGMTQSEFCLNALLAAIGEDLEKPAMDNVLTRLATLEKAVFNSVKAA